MSERIHWKSSNKGDGCDFAPCFFLLVALGFPFLVKGALLRPVFSGEPEIRFERTIEKEGTGHYLVRITIRKGDLTGFARITETLPDGFEARERETMEGVFSLEGDTMKILWMDLPRHNPIKVSYSLEGPARDGELRIDGNFSYIYEEKRLSMNTDARVSLGKVGRQPHPFSAPGDTTRKAQAGAGREEKGKKTRERDKVVETKGTQEERKQEKKAPSSAGEASEGKGRRKGKKSSSGAGGDVIFRVQIGAFKDPPPARYFADNYGLAGSVRSYEDGGTKKFTVGRFESVQKAESYRKELLESGLEGAFVVAFKEGERVPMEPYRE